MKKVLMMPALMLGLMSCVGSHNGSTNVKSQGKDDRVEVIYFCGKQRCATCMAIEENTREVVNSMFGDELRDGSVVFKVVDISTSEGEEVADMYEVTWSSLFVNRWEDGEETRNKLTEFGFGNARNNPDVFKQGLAEKIRQSLE